MLRVFLKKNIPTEFKVKKILGKNKFFVTTYELKRKCY